MARPIGSSGVSMDTVLRTLGQYPNGTTTRELAERLGIHRHNIGSRLNKAYLYGKGVEREFKKREKGGREATWRIAQ